MSAFHRLAIRHQLRLTVLVFGAVAVGAACLAVTLSATAWMRAETRGEMAALGTLLSHAAATALERDAMAEGLHAVNALREHPRLLVGVIHSESGGVFAQFRRSESQMLPVLPLPAEGFYAERLELVRSVRSASGTLLGTIYLRAGQPQGFVRNCLVVTLMAGLLGLCGALAFVSWLERFFTDPIHSLVRTVKQVGREENFSARAPEAGSDEIGQLARAFNALLAQLQIRDVELRRHRDHLGELVAQRTAELMQLNHALCESADKAEAATRTKTQFLANMSHELRTPLNAIIGYSEMLLENPSAMGQPEAHADLRRIHTAGRSLLTLINDALNSSQGEADKLALHPEPAGAAVPPTSQPVPRGGPPSVLVIDDDPPARDLMVRFLQKEGFSAQTAADGRQGLQMARQLRPALITLDVMMPEVDGWSVLAALKADPELANIPVVMITLAEEHDKGFALGAAEFLTKPVDHARLSGLLREYCPTPGDRPILIVEDDEISSHILRRNLEREGYPVMLAADGLAALELIRLRLPSLVLLDLMMPGMDGFSFAQAVRERKDLLDVPIIVLTAKDLSEEDRRRLKGNVVGILQKQALTPENFQRELHAVLVRQELLKPNP